MAIVINTAPGDYFSAQGDLLFVVYEAVKAIDPVTYPDYKYVADVYVADVLVARIKKVPQPDNKRGVFNIGDIVRNYLTTTFNPTPLQIQAQELGLGEFFIDVTVKFGEEYNFTTYFDLLVDATRRYFNHYNGRLIGALTNLPSVLDLVASNRPYANPVNRSNNFAFLSYLPTSASPFNVVITKYGAPSTGAPATIQWGYFNTDIYSTVDSQTMQFSQDFQSGLNNLSLNYTNAANLKYLVLKEPISQPVKTKWSNTVFNYGTIEDSVFRAPIEISGFRYYVSRIPVVIDSAYTIIQFGNDNTTIISPVISDTFTRVITPSDAQLLQILNLSPGVINYINPGFIDSGTLYYTVKIGITSIYRFDLDCELRFTPYRLHFLNKFGGFDSRDFTKVSRKQLAITKSVFGKLPYIITDTGGISYANSNNVYNETQANYASQYSEKITLNSDILSDADYVWLSELVASTLIYVELNGYFIPVSIAQTNYVFNKFVNDKLTVLTIDIIFGETYNAQFR